MGNGQYTRYTNQRTVSGVSQWVTLERFQLILMHIWRVVWWSFEKRGSLSGKRLLRLAQEYAGYVQGGSVLPAEVTEGVKLVSMMGVA